MQTNRFKIFSYPYLAEFTSDYKKSEFHIEGRAEYDSKNEYAHHAIFRMLDEEFLQKYNLTSASDLYRIGSIDSSFPLYLTNDSLLISTKTNEKGCNPLRRELQPNFNFF